jgi:hypothetical protein
MLSFKDQLARDMDSVFLNTGEFAETMEIEGVPVPAVLTDEADETANAEGKAVIGKRLHAKASDLPALYIGRTLIIDGVPYTVESEPDIIGGGLSVLLSVNSQ